MKGSIVAVVAGFLGIFIITTISMMAGVVLFGVIWQSLPTIHLWILAIYVPLAFIAILWFSIAVARFTLRCSPINYNGERRKGTILVLFTLLIFCCTPVLVVNFFEYTDENTSVAKEAFVTSNYMQRLIEERTREALEITEKFNNNENFALLLKIYATQLTLPFFVGIFIALWRHLNPRFYENRKYVLFLRKFSSFSDRTILGQVLKSVPAGLPVLFPASPGNRPGNWDAFMWAFSGTKLLFPITSMPIQIRTDDSVWQATLSNLIENAHFIIMDISNMSDNLKWELDQVSNSSELSKAIILCKEEEADPDPTEITKEEPLTIHYYQPSVRASIPRLLGESLFTIFLLVSIAFISIPLVVVVPVGVAILILFLLIYFRPGLTVETRRRIRYLIRTIAN